MTGWLTFRFNGEIFLRLPVYWVIGVMSWISSLICLFVLIRLLPNHRKKELILIVIFYILWVLLGAFAFFIPGFR